MYIWAVICYVGNDLPIAHSRNNIFNTQTVSAEWLESCWCMLGSGSLPSWKALEPVRYVQLQDNIQLRNLMANVKLKWYSLKPCYVHWSQWSQKGIILYRFALKACYQGLIINHNNLYYWKKMCSIPLIQIYHWGCSTGVLTNSQI